MSECTDKTLEKLLHAYELGMLTEEEAQQVEQHLYECDHCFNLAKEFQDVTQLLRHSRQVRSQISNDAAKHRTIGRSWVLLAAAAVFLLAFPVYKLMIDSGSAPVCQSLYLTPFRGNSSPVLDLRKGGTAKIQFVVEGASSTDTHRVVISARKGPTIYSDAAFAGFNQSGQGTIVLPVNRFAEGYYSLTVSDVAGEDTLTLAAYQFRVEEAP